MTLLQIVNRVLRRLREDQVTDLSAEYSLLVTEHVADAHREVLEAHDWSSMDGTVVVKLTAGTTDYALYSGSSQIEATYAQPNSKSEIRYADSAPIAHLYAQLADVATGTFLYRLDQELPGNANVDRNERASYVARPTSFSIEEHPTQDGLLLRLPYPPDANYWLSIRMHIPEAEVVPGTDSASRDLRAPSAPIIAGAVYYALNERGEELGESGAIAERRYRDALSAAIERDTLRSQRANSHEMYRD